MNGSELVKACMELAEGAIPFVDGDYDQDGIMYCGSCKTPKQTRIEIGGEVLTVRCLCKCGQAAYEKKCREEEAQKRREKIARLRINGVQDKAAKGFTFAADDGRTPKMDKIRLYADQWDEMREKNIGLLLWGNTGNGKTFAAGCIANALIDRGVPVLMTSFVKLLDAVSGMYGEQRTDYLDSLRHFKLLVIDDLGAERDTSYALEAVYNIIDTRYKQKLPIIMTTNMTLNDLKNPKDMRYQRIYDRVLEMCVPMHFVGESRRREMAAEKIKLIQALTD